MSDAFQYIEDAAGGPAWLHRAAPVWIRYYDAVEGVRLGYYQAYKSVARVPAGRMPWTVDNRRLGNADHGFPSLDAAMSAADVVAQEFVCAS